MERKPIQVKPNEDLVLLEMEEPKLPGGLIMPGAGGDKPSAYCRFFVKDVGPGKCDANGQRILIRFRIGQCVLVPPPVQVGPTTPPRMPCFWVMIGEPEAEGKKLFLIHAQDILCTVEGDYPKHSPGLVVALPVDARVKQAASKVLQMAK